MGDGEAVADFPDVDQRYAFCHAQWEARTVSNDTHKNLLTAVRSRTGGGSFGYGITTADRYIRSVVDCCGAEAFGSELDAVLKRASGTLTYAGPEMVVEEKRATSGFEELVPKGVKIPSRTLMVLQHVVTTPREDRDTDVLVTAGAQLDPKAPLLWQHMHTLPIGKVLATITHNEKVLRVATALLDLNELTSDAAKLVEADVLRFSHGFRALEYNERKRGAANPEAYPGFEIKRFEIMEVSLVSVPSNVDAEVELYAAGKLASPMFKAHAKFFFDQRPTRVPGFNPATDDADDGPAVPASKTLIAGVKSFDVASAELEPARLEYDWVAKFLDCQIKQIHQTGTYVPAARRGSFLSGLEHVTSDWETEDTRNITRDGREAPPIHEVIELNSTRAATFLTDGITFRRRGEERLVIKFVDDGWGMSVSGYSVEPGLLSGIIERAWEWARANNFLKGEAFSYAGRFLKRGSDGWDDLVLPARNAEPVARAVKRLNDDGAAAPSRGMIFMGPPGTGKTLSGRVMLNSAKATFIWLSAKDFYQCGAMGGICGALELARELAPSIVFMEDVDNWLSDYTTDALKTELDGIAKSTGVVTVLTTNYPERLPDALIDRPGRFSDVLSFDLPDAAAREHMLRKWADGASDEEIGETVERTAGYSGAHIYELASFAKTLAAESGEKTVGQCLSTALDKLAEQRELITQAQLSGSNYRPRGRALEAVAVKAVTVPAVETPAAEPIEDPATAKAGRVLSARNVSELTEIADDLDELSGADGLSRAQRALLARCRDRLRKLVTESGPRPSDEDDDEGGKKPDSELDVAGASTLVLASGSADDLRRLSEAITARLASDEATRRAAGFRKFART